MDFLFPTILPAAFLPVLRQRFAETAQRSGMAPEELALGLGLVGFCLLWFAAMFAVWAAAAITDIRMLRLLEKTDPDLRDRLCVWDGIRFPPWVATPATWKWSWHAAESDTPELRYLKKRWRRCVIAFLLGVLVFLALMAILAASAAVSG